MENPTGSWPCLTSDLEGTGGRIRERKEDFFVEEVPLYSLSGKGTHLYLFIEKRGIPTFEAIWRLARALKRETREFGVAGLKDADAVTHQYVSIEHVKPADLKGLEISGVKILDFAYHNNKLKMGHLKGNRFRIRIRHPLPGAAEKAAAVAERFLAAGVPNFFGPQRFGNLGNTHTLGEAVIKKDYKGFADILVGTPRESFDAGYNEVIACYRKADYEGALKRLGPSHKYERRVLQVLAGHEGRFDKAVAAIERRMMKIYLSAFQSYYFNRYLNMRLDRLDKLEDGEIAYIHRNGASFLVEDSEKEKARLDSFEISPSGPIFGNRMLRARKEPGAMELEVLKETGLELEDIRGRFGIRLRGARRPLRVPLEEWAVKETEEGLDLDFRLPPGSYASVVLREITKCIE